MNDEQKAVFQEASVAGAADFNQLIVEDEIRSMEQAISHGALVTKPEALNEWQKGAQGVWQHFADTIGGTEQIKAIQAA